MWPAKLDPAHATQRADLGCSLHAVSSWTGSAYWLWGWIRPMNQPCALGLVYKAACSMPCAGSANAACKVQGWPRASVCSRLALHSGCGVWSKPTCRPALYPSSGLLSWMNLTAQLYSLSSYVVCLWCQRFSSLQVPLLWQWSFGANLWRHLPGISRLF